MCVYIYIYYVICRLRWEFATVGSLQITAPVFSQKITGSLLVDHFLYPGNAEVMARKRAEAPYKEEEEEEEKVLVVSEANSPVRIVLRYRTTNMEKVSFSFL